MERAHLFSYVHVVYSIWLITPSKVFSSLPACFFAGTTKFSIWQFALHGFSNIHIIFIIALIKFFELFSQDFSHDLAPAHILF